MFQNVNKNKKNFIVAITMAIVLLFASALSSLIQTSIGPIAPPTQADSWANYAVKPAGTGYKSSPYQITSAGELAWLINNLSLRADNSATGDSGLEIHIDLLSDIDLADHEWSPIQAAPTYGITVTSTTYQGFLFFNGNNHTIYNMHMNKPNENKVGLFAGKTKINGYNVIQNMTIRDLTMANVDIIGYAEVGAVVGYCDYSNGLDNVHVTSGSVLGMVRVGGLVGNSTCFINNCTNAATVKASEGTVGGLVGDHASRSITNSINMGTVSSLNGYNIGGIAGSLGSWNNDGVMDNCLAECDIYGMRNIGGLVGSFTGNSITNSGFRGEIHLTATTNTKSIGSICGYNSYRASRSKFIENCFGLADVYADYNASSYILPYGVSDEGQLRDSYSYTKVHSSTGLSEYRTRRDGENNFDGMVYHKNINGGFPFARSLFAVGQFIDCDTRTYIRDLGFYNMPIQKDSAGHYYVELGLYPQTYVGNNMNNTLKTWFASRTRYSIDSFTNDTGTSGTVTHYAYNYTEGTQNTNGTYVRVASAAVYGSGYTFKNGATVTSGEEYWFRLEPIKWWILNFEDVQNGADAVVLAEQSLTANILWSQLSDGNLWSDTCKIRSWLNGTFYNDAFDATAKSNIKATTVKNNSQESDLDGAGADVVDSVWFLSNNEVSEKYFTSAAERLCSPTDYAIVNNAYLYTSTSYPTALRPNGGTVPWWLRSARGTYSSFVRIVDEYGRVSYSTIANDTCTVRPALTLNI